MNRQMPPSQKLKRLSGLVASDCSKHVCFFNASELGCFMVSHHGRHHYSVGIVTLIKVSRVYDHVFGTRKTSISRLHQMQAHLGTNQSLTGVSDEAKAGLLRGALKGAAKAAGGAPSCGTHPGQPKRHSRRQAAGMALQGVKDCVTVLVIRRHCHYRSYQDAADFQNLTAKLLTCLVWLPSRCRGWMSRADQCYLPATGAISGTNSTSLEDSVEAFNRISHGTPYRARKCLWFCKAPTN